MSIHVALNHVTHYRYERPIQLGAQVVRLRPAPHSRTRILSYSMRVEPAQHFINWQQDPLSNHLARLVFPEKTSVLRIEVDLVAEMSVYNPFDFFLEKSAEKAPFIYEPALAHELRPYMEKEAAGPFLQKLLDGINRAPRSTCPDGAARWSCPPPAPALRRPGMPPACGTARQSSRSRAYRAGRPATRHSPRRPRPPRCRWISRTKSPDRATEALWTAPPPSRRS